MSSRTSITYAQELTNIQHARLTPVVERCEKGDEPLTVTIHFKGGGQVRVAGLFAAEIYKRLLQEAEDEQST